LASRGAPLPSSQLVLMVIVVMVEVGFCFVYDGENKKGSGIFTCVNTCTYALDCLVPE